MTRDTTPKPGPSTPLLPTDFPTRPFVDATASLSDPRRLRRDAQERGYLYLPRLLGDELVAPMRAAVRSVAEGHGWLRPASDNPPVYVARPGARLERHGWDDPRWVALQSQLRHMPVFRALAQTPTLTGVLETIWGEPAELATANYCWLKLPGSPEQTTRPHQDAYYLPDSPRLWTAWVALVDTPFELGPIGVVARSNRRETPWPHVDPWTGILVPADTRWDTGEAAAGDVVLFDALTVHCAWSNVTSTRVRASFDLRYEPRSAVEGEGRSVLRPVPWEGTPRPVRRVG